MKTGRRIPLRAAIRSIKSAAWLPMPAKEFKEYRKGVTAGKRAAAPHANVDKALIL